MSSGDIVITGAREHNLRNIDVRLPRDSLIVITGLSGSGKSSLAFDTLYAEGQRRYVESLSAYARQFLDQLHKPDADRIEGLSPAIAIEQRSASPNPRSTVATTTEVHDYLRLLFANAGVPHCPRCGRELGRQSAERIVELLLALPARTKLILLAPLIRGRRGSHREAFEQARQQGFVRVRVDGEIHELESLPRLNARREHSIDVVVDRLIVTSRIRGRLTDSVELALKQGDGNLTVLRERDGVWEESLYSESYACADCGVGFRELTPRSFSFNSPHGACPGCGGLGRQWFFDRDLVVPDPALTLEQGAIRAWRWGGRRLILYYKRLLRAVAGHYGFGLDVPFEELESRFREILLHGSGEEEIETGYRRGGAWRRVRKPFEGVLPNLQRRYNTTDSDTVRQRLRRYMSRQLCPRCGGARLRPEALACTVGGRSLVELTALPVAAALGFFEALALDERGAAVAGDVLKEIRRRLRFLDQVGVGYLTLDRESGTLSGGEVQRLRLATQIGAGLVGVLYVLDEPTIGLHRRDNERLISMLKALRDAGNTVVVVEHDERMIRAADYVVDLGPGAGRHGGRVVCQGALADLLACEASLTARYLRPPAAAPAPAARRRPGRKALTVYGATQNNLRGIDVRIPLGLFVCVTGVSGSGKSSLVDDVLRRALFRKLHGSGERPGAHKRIAGMQHLDKVIVIDQAPIGRTPRSNPATYTGAHQQIRSLFAATPASRIRGYGPGRYSFNVKGGRCETCKGDGMLKLEMHFLPDVYVTCEQCRGTRYNRETLQVRYGGRNIAEVLAMTVDEALEFFQRVPAVARRLRRLSEVGLGYLQLGQSATTLSGGEAQRVKLSAELSKRSTGRTLYLLDEPTTGLHFADVRRLLEVLRKLVEGGNTVVVIEHNMDVIGAADYIVDLGPEGGDEGGRVVAAGTPEEIAACPASYTGRYLRGLPAVAAAEDVDDGA